METLEQRKPKNIPDPLDDVPRSHPKERLKINQRYHLNVNLPDLTVRRCDVELPEPFELDELDIPEGLRRRLLYRFGYIKFEVFNIGPNTSPPFDVNITVATSKQNDATNRVEIQGVPWVRTIHVNRSLRKGGRIPFHLFIPAVPHDNYALYSIVVDVNPMTKDHPLGRVVELDYDNNRCTCTILDHPGFRRPSEGAELPTGEIPELEEPIILHETDWELPDFDPADPSKYN